MLIQAKNNRQVFFRKLNLADLDLLYDYLQNLSAATKNRFSPHKFDKETIFDFYKHSEIHWAYVGIDIETKEIIAYSIIKIGHLEHDNMRFQSYGIQLDKATDATFAPSVADAWQSCGIGEKLFHFILSELKNTAIKRIILWGGVQMGNEKAVNYYTKNGFKIFGQFTHNGENYDMAFRISQENPH